MIPDAPGPLYGYRPWRVKATPRGLRLASIHYPCDWMPRAVGRAACKLPEGFARFPGFLGTPKNHRAPAEGCRCGFYALHVPRPPRFSYQEARELLDPDQSTLVTQIEGVYGVIAAWGRVAPAKFGFRAERVAVVAILGGEAVDELADIYGVPNLSETA